MVTENGSSATTADPVATGSRDSRVGWLFLRTLGFVLDNRRKAEKKSGKEWQTTTSQLQLVSLDACRAWRETTSVHLKVKEATPPRLWKQGAWDTEGFTGARDLITSTSGVAADEMEQSSASSRRRLEAKSRVPAMRVTLLTWERSSKDLNISLTTLVAVSTLRFGPSFNESLASIRWPTSGKIDKIVFGKRFNQSLANISWPLTLREIRLGNMFDQDVGQSDFPKSLRKLVFGESFNRPFTSWPAGLDSCELGPTFNQDLTSAVFPPHLRKLVFDWRFNSSLNNVVLPEGVEELEFRGIFDKPLPARLPAGLKKICLSLQFNQPIDSVQWPDSLENIEFGFHFNQPVEKVVWPASLQSITFGNRFQQSLSHVRWPESVREISLGRHFRQALKEISFPTGLRRLALAGNHPGQLDGVYSWPLLTTLCLDGEFNQPIDSSRVVWPASLKQLTFGWRFNQPIDRVAWPSSLKSLTVGGSFMQPVERVVLPDRLEDLVFSQNSSQPIQGLTFPKTMRALAVGRGSLVEARLRVPKGVIVSCYEYYSVLESL